MNGHACSNRKLACSREKKNNSKRLKFDAMYIFCIKHCHTICIRNADHLVVKQKLTYDKSDNGFAVAMDFLLPSDVPVALDFDMCRFIFNVDQLNK